MNRTLKLLIRLGVIALSAALLIFLCGWLGDLGLLIAIFVLIELWSYIEGK